MFCKSCGKEIENGVRFCPECGATLQESGIPQWHDNSASKSNVSSKSRLVACLLSFFVGWLGIHRFYVGKVGTGILQILLCWCLIGEIWALVDFIFIICGKFTDSEGKIISRWDV